jgi:hypothetical protein
MGAALLQGREFTERDLGSGPPVAIVNETFAKSFWPAENAVGKRFRTNSPTGPPIEIVGIAADGKYNSIGEAPQRHVFQPLSQGFASGFVFVLRTDGDPGSLASGARAELRAIDPALPITDVKTMQQHLGFAYWGPECAARLLSALAGVGLSLSTVGLYGMLAFVVRRSIPEIGIRMALGATPRSVQRIFIRRGIVITIAGSLAGIPLAFVATRAVAHYLFGVGPADATTFAAAPLLLLAVAAIACYLPSRKAATIDPLRALRHE